MYNDIVSMVPARLKNSFGRDFRSPTPQHDFRYQINVPRTIVGFKCFLIRSIMWASVYRNIRRFERIDNYSEQGCVVEPCRSLMMHSISCVCIFGGDRCRLADAFYVHSVSSLNPEMSWSGREGSGKKYWYPYIRRGVCRSRQSFIDTSNRPT